MFPKAEDKYTAQRKVKWFFGREFVKGTPNYTMSGLLDTQIYCLKVCRGGF